MMNDKKYEDSLKAMNVPIMPSQLPPMPNMKNVSSYAKAVGKKIGELTKEEHEEKQSSGSLPKATSVPS